jgi:putative ABC transport system substrate-binding protein
MRRRDFIAQLSGTAAGWPLAARAQPQVRVIGVINAGTRKGNYERGLAAFLGALAKAGYEDGRNVRIEYRWAEDNYDRLPAFATDLVARKVALIAALGTTGARAAKAATSTIPIVFSTGADPVEMGFVASLYRPGTNMTGATQMSLQLGPKRLSLMHELLPKATNMGLLVNPKSPTSGDLAESLKAAASTLGITVHVLPARDETQLAEVFASVPQHKIEALVVGSDAFFNDHSRELAALAAGQRLPAIYQYPEFTDAGGLMSLGGNLAETYRIAGAYAARILKGEKPENLAVQQTTKVDLIFNLKTARAFGLDVPPTFLARADEVIE